MKKLLHRLLLAIPRQKIKFPTIKAHDSEDKIYSLPEQLGIPAIIHIGYESKNIEFLRDRIRKTFTPQDIAIIVINPSKKEKNITINEHHLTASNIEISKILKLREDKNYTFFLVNSEGDILWRQHNDISTSNIYEIKTLLFVLKQS